jgi:hypothetical protein
MMHGYCEATRARTEENFNRMNLLCQLLDRDEREIRYDAGG